CCGDQSRTLAHRASPERLSGQSGSSFSRKITIWQIEAVVISPGSAKLRNAIVISFRNSGILAKGDPTLALKRKPFKILQMVPASDWYAQDSNGGLSPLICWALIETGALETAREILGMVVDSFGKVCFAEDETGFSGYVHRPRTSDSNSD